MQWDPFIQPSLAVLGCAPKLLTEGSSWVRTPSCCGTAELKIQAAGEDDVERLCVPRCADSCVNLPQHVPGQLHSCTLGREEVLAGLEIPASCQEGELR